MQHPVFLSYNFQPFDLLHTEQKASNILRFPQTCQGGWMKIWNATRWIAMRLKSKTKQNKNTSQQQIKPQRDQFFFDVSANNLQILGSSNRRRNGTQCENTASRRKVQKGYVVVKGTLLMPGGRLWASRSCPATSQIHWVRLWATGQRWMKLTHRRVQKCWKQNNALFTLMAATKPLDRVHNSHEVRLLTQSAFDARSEAKCHFWGRKKKKPSQKEKDI